MIGGQASGEHTRRKRYQTIMVRKIVADTFDDLRVKFGKFLR